MRARAGTRCYTVGAGAGFAGDRIEPAVRLAASGDVDAVVLECLAERTLISALRAREADPNAGHDSRLRRRLTPLLPAAARNGCRIVTNLGAANPLAAAEKARRLASELDLAGLKIAAVIGDDLMARRDEVAWSVPVDGGTWLGAHAYLGIEPIAEALAAGADVVITGRVADSSLFAAAPVAFLDLAADSAGGGAVAGALTAGHLLECAGQLSGGNLSAPGKTELSAADLADLGYPLAEIDGAGGALIRLLDGAPGRIDSVSCTLQLLYEVHDPTRYITPDAILDFSLLRFEPAGANRVRMTGARSRGRPDHLKVIGFVARRGIIADVEIGFAGTGALERARRGAEILRLRLARDIAIPDMRIDLVGVDSVLGAASKPLNAEPPEVRVHVSARCDDGELAQAVEDEVYALTLSGPAGGCSVRSERRPRIETVPGLIPRDRVRARVEWATR